MSKKLKSLRISKRPFYESDFLERSGALSYLDTLTLLVPDRNGPAGFPELMSPSLKVLDIHRVGEDDIFPSIQRLCCPSLVQLICADTCTVAGTHMSTVVENTEENADCEETLQQKYKASKVKIIPAAAIETSNDFSS